jgi:hypothetical protein
MYGKTAMTCFKYQVYLYGSEAITYLNAYFEWLQNQHYESSDFPHSTLQAHYKQPSPPLYGSRNFTHLPYALSINQECKIGLRIDTGLPDKYLFKTSTIKSVISIHEEILLNLQDAFSKSKKYNVSACFFEPNFESKFCPGFSSLSLVVSVFASLLLVSFLQCTVHTITGLRNNFQDHTRRLVCIFRFEIAAVVKTELIFIICM